MKAILFTLLLATAAVYGADEKKTEKRGVLGLGYGIGAPAPVLGHGIYGGGLGHGYYGGGLGLYNRGFYGGGLYGHGLYGNGLGLGHGVVSHAPLVAPAPLLGHGVYGGAPLGYGSPYLGLGHGILH